MVVGAKRGVQGEGHDVLVGAHVLHVRFGKHTGIGVFLCRDPTWPSSVDALEVMVFYIVFFFEENFHCQTYLLLMDLESNSCLFQGYQVPWEFLQSNRSSLNYA